MPQTFVNTATFDGNSLTTVTGLTILSTNPYVPARRKLTTYELARTNSSKVNSAFYKDKNISIIIGITRATRDLLEQSIDSLMALIQGVEKPLIVRQAGGLRKYTATFVDSILKNDGGSYCEMELVFETSDHYGYANAAVLLAQISGFTSGQKTTQITVLGSAAWQAPLITLTVSALTGGTDKYVILSNDATGQAVTITRTWTAGDVIEISALNNTVKVNGVEVAFSGAIPQFAPGTGYLSYSDNFTSRTWSMTATHIPRYV